MLVSFHELASFELNEAAEYYDSESTGLGQAFITEVERCTEEIVRPRYQLEPRCSWR
jgi:hypothetical protein